MKPIFGAFWAPAAAKTKPYVAPMERRSGGSGRDMPDFPVFLRSTRPDLHFLKKSSRSERSTKPAKIEIFHDVYPYAFLGVEPDLVRDLTNLYLIRTGSSSPIGKHL